MPASNQSAQDMQNYRLQGTTPSWAGNTFFWAALCSADPTPAGTGTSMNEVSYTSYARVAVIRTSSGFVQILNGQYQNAALISWPECTGGTVTATHIAFMSTVSGAGTIIEYAPLSSSLAISNNVIPQVLANTFTSTQT